MSEPAPVHTDSIEALGTHWWIEVFEPVPNWDTVATHIREHIITFEHQYSRFRHDSLVTKLNQERQLSDQPKTFNEVLQTGQQLYTATDGVFNMLLGNILEARGYGSLNPGASPREIANPLTDLEISEDQITLANGLLDIGGFGKGYVIDEIAQICTEEYGINSWLINGGGDMRVNTVNREPITIYLEHPQQHNSFIGSIELTNCAFAASSPFKRAWHTQDGHTYNHLIDSNTQERSVVQSCYTTATTATLADAYATAASIMSIDTALSMAQDQNIGLAIVTEDNTLTQNPLFPIIKKP